MKITLELLKEHGACAHQSELFARLWPKGGKVTLRNLRRARKAGLDVGWLARLISPTASKVYNESVAPARKVYDEAVATASKVYNEAVDAALVAAFAD